MTNFYSSEDATPLEHEELMQLIPKHISNQQELNEWEQANIIEALQNILNKKFIEKEKILDIKFILNLHKKMFGKTWKWAGKIRSTNKNIGVDKSLIMNELKKLIDDVQFFIDNLTYTIDEIAVRFHHRLVFIHPFNNGNGRHARLMADLLIISLGGKKFTWGGTSDLISQNNTRKNYISALRKADNHDFNDLILFARENN